MGNPRKPPILVTEQVIQRLAGQFTVRDIMIPLAELITATTEEEAIHLLHDKDDFNLIPIETEAGVTGYVERGIPGVSPINLDVTVGSGCSILDLVDVLVERQFCFVVGKWGIEGCVHFSDLNHHLIRLPFYLLLQAVEAHVIFLIGDEFEEVDNIRIALNKEDANRIIANFNKHKVNNANRELLNEASLKEMLKFARRFGIVALNDDEIEELYAVRNCLAHVPNRLVEKHDDVKRLMWTTR